MIYILPSVDLILQNKNQQWDVDIEISGGSQEWRWHFKSTYGWVISNEGSLVSGWRLRDVKMLVSGKLVVLVGKRRFLEKEGCMQTRYKEEVTTLVVPLLRSKWFVCLSVCAFVLSTIFPLIFLGVLICLSFLALAKVYPRISPKWYPGEFPTWAGLVKFSLRMGHFHDMSPTKQNKTSQRFFKYQTHFFLQVHG